MPPADAVTILHLSDLHFGRKHRFEREGMGSLLERLRQDLDERIARDGLRPDMVVLSGDFAEYGKREEFEQASRFVCGLRAHLGLPARRIVIVPGNHDINWNKSRAYFEDREGDGLPAVEPYFPKFVHYQRFFRELYAGEDGIAFTEEAPWSFFELPDLGVAVAGLNSAFAESHRENDHQAFVGEQQIREFAGKLKPYKERGFLRIGVMHHDPFDKRGGARVEQDQRDLRRWLVPELNLVLHGDIHEETLRYLDRDVPAIGVGSAAVGVDERGPDVSNEYQVLVVRAGGIDRHLRGYVSDQKRWVASPRADAAGEQGKTSVRVDFDGVTALGRRAAPAPTVDLADIVARYRAAMARDQGAPTVFDLLGVSDPSDGVGGLDFLRLFIPQDAVRDMPPPARIQPRDAWVSRSVDGSDGPSEVQPVPGARQLDDGIPERARSVDELFDHRRLLFVGAPGAGKSAFTRWLLLKLCIPGERVQALPDELVPVRIELRRFDEEHRRAGAGYTFLDHVARAQADRNGPVTIDHLRALAGSGRVLWLFDGLDEVADPQRRREMAERIAGLLDGHDDWRAIVTSRVAGVDVARPLLESAGFQTYAIQDFTAEQRDRFLDAWHQIIFSHDPTTGAQRRTRMAVAIETTPSLQELCKSPLLCTLLAYLHREESLPQRRHRLYQKVLERMAEHWDANKGLPPRPSAERFELEDKLSFLRALAWEMQSDTRTAGNAVSRTALEDVATGFCEQRWGQPKDAARRRAEALINQLHARNGVLTYLGGDTYGFAHRAFLEYLAASEVVERFRGRRWELSDLVGVLKAHWQQAGWEETLLLMFGLLHEDSDGPGRVVRLLQGIGEGRLAAIYGELLQYLAFCIKALGELPQLETWVPGDFARAINDLLMILIREEVTDLNILTLAFRRCAGRWPELPRLVRAMEHPGHKIPTVIDLSSYDTWIAAGGRAHRVQLLVEALQRVEALRSNEAIVHLACKEASRLGPWSNDEISAVLDACRYRSEYAQLIVAASIVTTKGQQSRDQDGPVEFLFRLANGARSEGLRLQSAWALLRARCRVDEAKTILLQGTRSTNQYAAEQATLWLVDQGFGDLVLETLNSFAQGGGSAIVELAKLATHLPRAAELLRDKLRAIRCAEDPEIFLAAALSTISHGFRFFRQEDILDRWRKVESRTAKTELIRRLLFIPGGQRICARACMELLAQGSPHLSSIASCSVGLTLEQVGPLLFDLWRSLLDLGNPDISIPIAARIIRLSPGGDIQARADRVVENTLSKLAPEAVRLQAARSFRDVNSTAKLMLEELARSAEDEWIRSVAACSIGDLRALNTIVERTKIDDYRNHARHALDVYGHIDFLLRVGHPRRARVRLDGRDVGTLEELTKMGNGTRFQYDADYNGHPISPNMPLGATYTDEETLLPFFDNLLPEGVIYEQTARRLGLKRSDRFGMLLRLGADTMGAVEVVPLESA